MKLFISACFIMHCLFSVGQSTQQFNDTAFLQPIEVTATRASEKAPFAKTDISKKAIAKNNMGQDLPFLLNQTPSVVVNSDAGNGIGYTGLRIRGTDATRINVTMNGIPYNDAESQGTYFVDIPDIASSTSSIQVQRGVGTSSNGAGAFGATINIATNEVVDTAYGELNNSYGSFNSLKNTVKAGSGLIGKHFTVDGRFSRVSSDGYIDRAACNLRSFYFSTAWLDKNNSLRLNIISGKEKTYQAWNGVPESFLKTDRTYNSAGMDQPGSPYKNETDNYTQTHYQLFYNHAFASLWKASLAAFLTKGSGYYEQYKAGEELAAYGLPPYVDGTNIVTKTDLVRRLWLDNSFYGTVFSVQYKTNTRQLSIGGGLNRYDGKHFGEVIRATVQQAVPPNYRWYDLTANKQDASLYTKWTEQLDTHWQTFVDIQFRTIAYKINGFEDNPTLRIDHNWSFLNPKAGVTYSIRDWRLWLSYAMASKEPNRDDFEASQSLQPKPEKLNDFEFGIEKKSRNYSFAANIYLMDYKDQLVLVGNINDVGAYTRINIPKSHRAGIELQGQSLLTDKINISANVSFSENKINDYTDLVDDYDNGGTKQYYYKKTTIAFSPSVVAGSAINFIPVKGAEISFLSKYVSRQYLDNTSQKTRSLNPYFVQDIRLAYTLPFLSFKEVGLVVQLNNVLNRKYEANGYTFSYISGTLTTENYYFPMAPFNCMVGINIRL